MNLRYNVSCFPFNFCFTRFCVCYIILRSLVSRLSLLLSHCCQYCYSCYFGCELTAIIIVIYVVICSIVANFSVVLDSVCCIVSVAVGPVVIGLLSGFYSRILVLLTFILILV